MSALTDRPVAVITGGGTGIGRATALTLATAGWSLSLAGRRREPLQETADACRNADPDANILVVPTDVTDPNQCQTLIDATDSHFHRLDALINNAGGGGAAFAKDADPDQVLDSFRLNALAPATLIHFAWPLFERQGGGCVVNVSSMAAHDPFPGLYAYGAGKAACESLVRSIHNERGDLKLRAFAVAPGAVETELLRTYVDETVVPKDLCMTPEHIASVIVACVRGNYDEYDGGTILVPDQHTTHAQPLRHQADSSS